MNGIVRLFGNNVVFVGDWGECRRLEKIAHKWGNMPAETSELFDDGLTYDNHCMSLYIQNDSHCWHDLYFNWTPAKFSWGQMKKAMALVKKHIVPRIGKYRKHGDKSGYSVVSLTF